MINQKLKEIMEENGIIYDNNRLKDLESINSITFVSAIVDIEEAFQVVIPDEYIAINLIEDFDVLNRLIQELIQAPADES